MVHAKWTLSHRASAEVGLRVTLSKGNVKLTLHLQIRD